MIADPTTVPEELIPTPFAVSCKCSRPTEPSAGTPTPSARPNIIMKASWPVGGADANVIVSRSIVYADSASWIIPPSDTNKEYDEPGVKTLPPDFRLKVVLEPLNCDDISSNFR